MMHGQRNIKLLHTQILDITSAIFYRTRVGD